MGLHQMKHGIVQKCMISTDGSRPSGNWYRFVPRKISRQHLEAYIMSRKYILSNYKKIPKSLHYRLQHLCPNCQYIQCSCKKTKIEKGLITCQNCKSSFLFNERRFDIILQNLKHVNSYCKLCKLKTEQILINYRFSRIEKAKKIRTVVNDNIAKHIELFKYRLLTKEDNLLFPPSFLWNKNSTLNDLILKCLKRKSSYEAKRSTKNSHSKYNLLDIKPDPYSYIGRGKLNCFRKNILSKRSYNSSRAVAVPVPDLCSNEIILNRDNWESMNCPDTVASVRYPVIDNRAITFHKVKDVWDKPASGFPVTCIAGKNLDFDGDQTSDYAPQRETSKKECEELLNPENSFVSMGEIKVNFTHNHLESLYSFFGITRNKIYTWLFNLYLLNGSNSAYTTFEKLRTYLDKLNNIVKPTVSYNLFFEILKDFLVQNSDFEQFLSLWTTSSLTKDCLFSRYIKSNSTRWKFEHLFQMVQYLRGMSKIQYVLEAFSCRTALSKAGVEFMGYATHKLSYTLPELWFNKNGMVYYGYNQVAYRSLRRLYTPIPSFNYVKNLSTYKILNNFKPNP